MKPRLLVSCLVALCLAFVFAGSAWAASATVKPNQFPNGATDTPTNNVIHTRLEVQFTVTTLGAGTVGPEVTVTLPSELTLKTGITARSYTQGATAQVDKAVFVARNSGGSVVAAVGTVTTSSFQVDITTNPAVGDKLIFEWDMTTPANFTQAEAATIDITFPNSSSTEPTANVSVSRKQNSRLTFITFSEPTLNNDTTSAEGTGYKITFPSALPDLVHDDNTKSTAATGNPNGSNNSGTGGNSIDDFDDMIYRFWASQDSTLVKVGSGATRVNILEMKRVPTDITNATLSSSLDKDAATDYTATPSGLVQSPTSVDESLVTELFTTRFADANLEGLVDTRGLAAGNWFIYVSTDKTGDYFLGRSGRLNVRHAPGFLAAAWDGDQTGDFSSNSIVENTVDAASTDDAYSITLDSGQLFSRTGVQSANEVTVSGAAADYKTNVDLAFVAVDYDNPTADVAIFVSTNSGLTADNLTTSGSSITGLTGARMVSRSDTLTLGARRHNFKPEDKISVLGTDTTFVAAGSYTVYFCAFDGTNKTVEKAFDLNSSLTKTTLSLTVKHSPKMNVDPEAFDSGSANRLTVNTGATNSTGKPQRTLRISWEQNGLEGVKSVEVTPTIDLYFSTSATYTTAATLKAAAGVSDDVHKINTSTITLSNKARFQNHFDWDLWSYRSPETTAGTVPAASTDYYIYAIVKAGSTERLARFDNAAASPTAKSVRFTHDSYISPILPAKDVTVGPDDPVVFTWEAADVDNAGGASSATGLVAANGTSTSPDIMIILSATDFGATTTRSVLNIAGNYVANSRDGDDTAPTATTGVVRLHEGVDTSFVWTANKMTTTIAGAATAIPAGTYTPYIIINGNALNIAAAPFVNNNDFAYRMPGKIVLTSTGGSNPTTARFVFPTQVSASSGELVRIPIVADDGGVTVGQANIYVSVDTTYFEPVDKDPATAGTQPYTLGTNSALSSSKIVGNTAEKVGNKWRLDFIYRDASGFTFLDGFEKLVDLHLKARKVSGTVNTTVTLENDPSGGRQTSLYLLPSFGVTRINTTIPGASSARIDPRGSISGTVPLQGRSNYTMPAADVTFFLRKGSLRGPTNTGTANQAGGFDTVTDSDFVAANDSTTTLAGIQKALPATGAFTLSEVPAGDYTLVVFVDRYLAGQREVSVKPGEAVTGVQPTLDGRSIERGWLLAGDAAGYDHDGLASTNTRPDNFIDGSDASAITAAIFAKPLSQGGTASQDSLYRAYPYADVDGSGQVNGVDLNFATVNTTTINPTATNGIDPVKPTFNLKPATMEGGNANAAFLLVAAPASVKAGEEFDVTVQVKGAVAARAYEFHLGYDPSRVAPQGVVSKGDLLARYGVNLAERDLVGDYGVTGSARSVTAAATGDGSLATVRFRAIQGGPAAISILDGFLIDAQLNVERPKMDGSLGLSVAAGPMKLHDASGAVVLGLISLDDAKVDFNDFFALAEAFGARKDAVNFNPLADLNEDGAVDFNDFFIFAENFGKVTVDAPVATKRSNKPVGDNPQGTLSLTALGGRVKPGQTVTLDAVLSGAEARGVGFSVTYDPARFEFVEAVRSGEELFLARPDGEGRIAVARAVEGGLDGSVARLVFRAKGEFEEPGRFQIADGLILGADGLIAQVAPGEALALATTPAEFALGQNFPNPFNPETTIRYSLADDAQVQLRIYNLVGQVVRTLVQERQAAGRYAIRWDGRDERGLTVSSGVYFYQITAGKFKDVRKLMLLK
jgi:hypothetical protein